MLEISKNEFLSKLTNDIRTEAGTDVRDVLEQVWVQASAQALYDHEVRVLQHEFGQAVMHAGGPEQVGERVGVHADTIKRWVVRPMDMTLSELRRLQLATGTTLNFSVLAPIESKED